MPQPTKPQRPQSRFLTWATISTPHLCPLEPWSRLPLERWMSEFPVGELCSNCPSPGKHNLCPTPTHQTPEKRGITTEAIVPPTHMCTQEPWPRLPRRTSGATGILTLNAPGQSLGPFYIWSCSRNLSVLTRSRGLSAPRGRTPNKPQALSSPIEERETPWSTGYTSTLWRERSANTV